MFSEHRVKNLDALESWRELSAPQLKIYLKPSFFLIIKHIWPAIPRISKCLVSFQYETFVSLLFSKEVQAYENFKEYIIFIWEMLYRPRYIYINKSYFKEMVNFHLGENVKIPNINI